VNRLYLVGEVGERVKTDNVVDTLDSRVATA
jgi:hypothetical protein